MTGFETELSMMLTDNWDLTANYSYTNAEIDEYINTDQAILVGCNPRADDYYDCIQANGSVEGNQTPRSPASSVIAHDVPYSDGSGRVVCRW